MSRKKTDQYAEEMGFHECVCVCVGGVRVGCMTSVENDWFLYVTFLLFLIVNLIKLSI